MNWNKLVNNVLNFGDGGVAANREKLKGLTSVEYSPFGNRLEIEQKYTWYCIKNQEEEKLVEQCLGNNSITKELFIFQMKLLEYPVWICLSEKANGIEFAGTVKDFKRKYDDFCTQIAVNTPISRKLKEDEKVKIIVVDDMPKVRTCIMDKIKCDAYEFVKEKDSPENLETDIKKIHPHLVLMDVYMGDYMGTDEMKKLKREYLDVCYIIMSSSREEKTPALMAGANAFIYKDIAGTEMKEIIDREIKKMFG